MNHRGGKYDPREAEFLQNVGNKPRPEDGTMGIQSRLGREHPHVVERLERFRTVKYQRAPVVVLPRQPFGNVMVSPEQASQREGGPV